MQNRAAAVIITILAVFLCGFPGLAGICWGLFSLVDWGTGLGWTGITTSNGYVAAIFGGVCGGLLLIVIMILIAFFVLRKKKETPAILPPDEPIPPAI